LNLSIRFLWIVGGLLGLVAVARMFTGPFQLAGIPVNVPLNPEGSFGLAMTVLLAWRTTKHVEAPVVAPTRLALAACGAALVSVISQTRVVGLYFLSDDFYLLRQTREWTWERLVPLFTGGGGDGFFRPIGLLSMAVNAAWAGNDPRLWHLSSVILHTSNVVLVTWLAGRLGLRWYTAFLAGALFAVHGTHPEAAAWIAGRFDLLAVFFTVGGMLLFTFERRWTQLAALACCLCAVLSKEAAFVFPFLLLLMLRLQRRPVRASIPFFVLTALAFLYRWILQGGIGGYVSAETGRPSAFTLGLGSTAKVVFVRLWTSLYFPINWSVEPKPLLAVLALAMVAAVLFLAARSRPGPIIWFALAALLVSILPPLHLLGGAADLSGGRLLYLPSVWFCLMLAAAVEGVPGKAARAACAAAILLFHWTSLQYNLDSWEIASREVRKICSTATEDAPPSSLPGYIRGVPAMANAFPECLRPDAPK